MFAQDEIVSEYTRQPSRYANIDGMMELYCGLWILAGALLAATGRMAAQLWRPAFAASLVAWQVFLWFGLRVVRRRVTCHYLRNTRGVSE